MVNICVSPRAREFHPQRREDTLSTKVVPIPVRESWSRERAEALLRELPAVRAVRLVLGRSGRLDEVHVLATDEIGAKQVVRNVESALFRYFGRAVDHRKISVAQVRSGRPQGQPQQREVPAAPIEVEPGPRLVLTGHEESEEPDRRVRARVSIELAGRRFEGSADGADVAHARLEASARATLRAIEAAARSFGEKDSTADLALELDGVSEAGGFECRSVLVSVTVMNGRYALPLSGAARINGSPSRSATLAALQATDRWVRGRLKV